MKKNHDKKKIASEKWGEKVMNVGYCIIPSILLRAQRRLGLSPCHLAIVLQLVDHWWDPARKPYPSKKTLSDRMGIGERQIQRYMAELEGAGLIKRISRYHPSSNGRLSNEYDFSGLVKKIKDLEPEFTQLANENKQKQQQISMRGGLKNEKKV
ncbi:MAG: helix-turn-helix domain-containing protein [Alphaproteobacteria bacterium]|nr:helix-turn-helix domain-containing protein [Alphaproteobacteria bacterium]